MSYHMEILSVDREAIEGFQPTAEDGHLLEISLDEVGPYEAIRLGADTNLKLRVTKHRGQFVLYQLHYAGVLGDFKAWKLSESPVIAQLVLTRLFDIRRLDRSQI